MSQNEEIKLINDELQILVNDNWKKYSVIITNFRLLILDFPNQYRNSLEDLRTSQRLYYVRKKEIVFEIKLKNLKKIKNDNNTIKMYTSKTNYILIKNNDDSKEILRKINSIRNLKK